MLKASNTKPEVWESWEFEIERHRCGTGEKKVVLRISVPEKT